MTAPAWYHRRAPRSPLAVDRMLAAGGLIESPFRWCEPMAAPRRFDWTAYGIGLATLAAVAVAAKVAGVW